MRVIKLILTFLYLFFSLTTVSYANEDTPAAQISSDRYIEHQTFKKRTFFKDNNIWVYNPSFASTFGMPPQGVSNDLKGIEAAAFRVESTNYQQCGFGGVATNCKPEVRYVLDIYVDEKKHPLPWADNQTSDWLNEYNSLLWISLPPPVEKTPGQLKLEREMGVKVMPVAVGGSSGSIHPEVIPSFTGMILYTLHPFVDSESMHEANWYTDGGTPRIGSISSMVQVYGYKKAAINGLTMITLDYHFRSGDRMGTKAMFYLDARTDIAKEGLIKRIYEFELPDVYTRQIDTIVKTQTNQQMDYFKALYESMQQKK